MTVALLGIMLLQLSWYSNSLKVRRDVFDGLASEAMISTSLRMERLRQMKLYAEFNEKQQQHQRQLQQLQHGQSHITFSQDAKTNEIYFSYQSDSVTAGEVNAIIQHFFPGSQNLKTDNNEVSFNDVEADMKNILDQLVMQVTPTDTTMDEAELRAQMAEHIGGQIQSWGNLTNQMAVEFFGQKQSELFDTTYMSQILKHELSIRGLDLPFDYGIRKNGQFLKTSTDFDKINEKTLYHTDLNKGTFFRSDQQMVVAFPSRRFYVFKTLALQVFLSILFCTIVMVVFGLSVYYMLRQKKIDEMKTDFINNMTHEFKTPIATIGVAADSITNPRVLGDAEKIQYFSSMIKQENVRMNKQVETILQIAKLDKEDYQFNWQPASLNDLVHRAIDGIIVQIDNRGGYIDFTIECEDDEVMTDHIHCVNMLNNLLDNANKYSKDVPQITVTTTSIPEGVWVSVKDHGIGMTKQVQTKIFEKFYRETSGNVHNVKGFGLGLNYVKAVSVANKGLVEVKSELGKGSEFRVFVPRTL